MSNLTPMQLEVANLIVDTLNLEIAPTDIGPDDALFYQGLGLDSIDALELVLEISRTYGFEMRAEDEQNEQVFASLRALSDHIKSNRVK